jgi:hypothetical protein
MTTYPIINARHGYAAGLALGVARQHGLDVEPVIDEHGWVTAAMHLRVPAILAGGIAVTLTLVIDPEGTE